MYDLLAGLTVIEGAAFIAGPSCGLHLAQMGADVIRFDQIGGGPDSRRWPLSANGESLYWEGLNKAKRSIAIDLAQPAGRELAQRIATAGDGLFVTNFPERGFLSYDRLKPLRRDLICLRVMGWADGTTAVDYTINAAVGVPMMTGPVDDVRPVNHVLPAWDLMAGTYGAFALLAARHARATDGEGREVRLALSDLAATTLGHLGAVAETLQDGDRARSGNDLFGAFGRDFATRDGERLMIVAITARQWTGLIDALDVREPIAATESRLGVSFAQEEGARFAHRDVLNPIIAQAVGRRSIAECRAIFDASGVCWSRYQSLATAIAEEPRLFSDNPLFTEIGHPSGAYLTPGAPVRLDTPPGAPSLAPRIGQHTDQILADLLGLQTGEIARLHDEGVVA